MSDAGFQLFSSKRRRVEAPSSGKETKEADEGSRKQEETLSSALSVPPPADDAVLSDEEEDSFASLGLPGWLVRTCEKVGLETPTPVQRNCIPEILRGRDVVGCAQTGSGKVRSMMLVT